MTEGLYSVATRMVAARGAAARRRDWPADRAAAWRTLDMLLTAVPSPVLPGTADPAWQLASRCGEDGEPIGVGDAVRAWNRRLGIRPPAAHFAQGTVVALPFSLHLIVKQLLGELVERLAPGRPPVTIGAGGAHLAAVAHDLADAFRAAVTGPSSRPAVPPGLRGPRPLVLPRHLAAVARAAAEAIPAPTPAAPDLTVPHEAVAAAADLLAGLADPAGPRWRERYDGNLPEVHMLRSYRWKNGTGQPIGFADLAAELRAGLRDLRPPWRPTRHDPLPATDDQRAWIVVTDEAALITAELLEELAARLRPGRRVGTVRLATRPLAEFVEHRLYRAMAVSEMEE